MFFLLTFLAIFLPIDYTDKLQLTNIILDYKAWISGLFLVSGVMLVVRFIFGVSRFVSGKRRILGAMKTRKRKLHNLTPQEKKILLQYFTSKTTSQPLPINDGVVNELAAYKIISRSSSLSQWGTCFSYNIQPWARDYLSKRPELLKYEPSDAGFTQLDSEYFF